MLTEVFDPGTLVAEAGFLWVQGQPDLQRKFQGSQGYTRNPVLRNQSQTKPEQQQTEKPAQTMGNTQPSLTMEFLCVWVHVLETTRGAKG